MKKRMYMGVFLLLLLTVAVHGLGETAGVITFQIKVLPGLSISTPELLVFEPVAPGQTTSQELNLTVWSNVNWRLMVTGEQDTSGLEGDILFQDWLGSWIPLVYLDTIVIDLQQPTGPEGTQVTIPFRFEGSYQDLPGTYSLDVKFTVVPTL